MKTRTMLLAALLALTLTACGNANVSLDADADVDVSADVEEIVENNSLSDDCIYDICYEMSSCYDYGMIDEDECISYIQNSYNLSIAEAFTIYETYIDSCADEIMTDLDAVAIMDDGTGESAASFAYDCTDEIRSATEDSKMIQICDTVFTFPINVGEFVEATGAELITDTDGATAAIERDPCLTELRAVFDTAYLLGKSGATGIDSLAESARALFRLPNGEAISVWMSDEGNGLERVSEMSITEVLTGSTGAVYLPGGIHCGMTYDEVNEAMASIGMEGNWSSSEGDYKTSLEMYKGDFTIHADVDNEVVYSVADRS